MSTTHLVGPLVQYKGRVIQRCCICGEKLDDYRLDQIAAISPTGTQGTGVPHFPEAHLLRVSEGNPKSFVVLGDYCKQETVVPEDFCLSLVEK